MVRKSDGHTHLWRGKEGRSQHIFGEGRREAADEDGLYSTKGNMHLDFKISKEHIHLEDLAVKGHSNVDAHCTLAMPTPKEERKPTHPHTPAQNHKHANHQSGCT